jgi:hypothetical protein
MRRTFRRHHAHAGLLARLLRDPRFLDAAVAAAARHQSVFDAAIDLGLGRGTAPAHALARVALSYATLRRPPRPPIP